MIRRASTDQDRAVLIFLAIIMVYPVASGMRHATVRNRPIPEARSTVDPNVAAWWELATLPRIGRALANRIIDFRTQSPGGGDGSIETAVPQNPARPQRDSSSAASSIGLRVPAFRALSDLDNVRGIGPSTILRVSDHVHFDQPG